MMRRVLAVCAVVMCTSSALAFEFVSPAGGSVGRAVQLYEPRPSDLLNLPIGTATSKWWRVETGLSRSYDLKDFDQVFAVGGYRRGNITVALGYSQFGHSDLYTEKLVKGSISFQRRSWSVGLSGSFMSLGFGGGYESLNAAAIGLAAGWRSARWQLAAFIDDINSPSFARSDPARPPRISLHGEFVSGKSYSLLGRFTMQKGEQLQFGAGQRIIVKQTSALLWGFTTAPFTFGGGIELGLGSSRLIYSANYHPVLGLTQMISVSYGSTVKKTTVDDGLR
jgi:hypothetical protein